MEKQTADKLLKSFFFSFFLNEDVNLKEVNLFGPHWATSVRSWQESLSLILQTKWEKVDK